MSLKVIYNESPSNTLLHNVPLVHWDNVRKGIPTIHNKANKTTAGVFLDVTEGTQLGSCRIFVRYITPSKRTKYSTTNINMFQAMSVSNEWYHYVPWVTTALLGGFIIYKVFKNNCCSGGCGSDSIVNLTVKKDCPKVVDKFDIEDLTEKNCFCRCWRSKTFPKCDGSHTEHNKRTGDNVGPLVIKPKSS